MTSVSDSKADKHFIKFIKAGDEVMLNLLDISCIIVKA